MWATRASSGTSSSSLNFAPMVRAGHCSRPHPPSRPHSYACTRACACTLSRQWHIHTRTQLCVHAYVHTDTSHLQGDEPHVFLPFIQLACHSHVVVAYCCIGLSPSWKWHRWQCRCTANSLIMLLTQSRFPRLASRLFAPYPPLLLRSAGKMRYANNSQYKNDTMIRKEVRPLTRRPQGTFSWPLTLVCTCPDLLKATTQGCAWCVHGACMVRVLSLPSPISPPRRPKPPSRPTFPAVFVAHHRRHRMLLLLHGSALYHRLCVQSSGALWRRAR